VGVTAVLEGAAAQMVLLAAAFGRLSARWLDSTVALTHRAIGQGLLSAHVPLLKGAFQGQFRLGVVAKRVSDCLIMHYDAPETDRKTG
jgi:hypothetical protein